MRLADGFRTLSILRYLNDTIHPYKARFPHSLDSEIQQPVLYYLNIYCQRPLKGKAISLIGWS